MCLTEIWSFLTCKQRLGLFLQRKVLFGGLFWPKWLIKCLYFGARIGQGLNSEKIKKNLSSSWNIDTAGYY